MSVTGLYKAAFLLQIRTSGEYIRLPPTMLPSCQCGEKHTLAEQMLKEGAVHGDTVLGRVMLTSQAAGTHSGVWSCGRAGSCLLAPLHACCAAKVYQARRAQLPLRLLRGRSPVHAAMQVWRALRR